MSSKSLVIKLEDGWRKIYDDGILKLQNILQNDMQGDTFNNQEFVELYTTVYKMCIQKEPHWYTPELYNRFQKCIEKYLTEVSLPAILNQGKMGEYMLSELVRQWESHKIMQRWMVNFFSYLNRFYVKRYHKKPLKEVCISQFRMLVFERTKIQASKATLELIESDREGANVDRTLLRKVIQIFAEMGMGKTTVYNKDFEAPFLAATKAYYSRQSASWIESDSCPQILIKAQDRIQEERMRLRDFLHSSSEKKLNDVLLRTLLLKHQTEILGKRNTGCVVMLQTDSRSDLARMYNLYGEVPTSLEPIGKMVKDHIVAAGIELISEFSGENDPLKYVMDLIDIHDRYYSLVTDVFKNNSIFDKALKDAFEVIVNTKMPMKQSTAELLSTYCDCLLKKNGIRMDEADLEETLDKIVRLFSYLLDKDMFLQFYRKMLSKRLLMSRSASEDAEKSLIGKLKLRCGAQFTSKLEGMINDMKNASEHQALFKQHCVEHAPRMEMELHVQVLTTTYWPSYKEDELQLHKSMIDATSLFERYYDHRTSNRRLKWIHSLGIATLNANFDKKRISLEVSTIQACVLMVLNDISSISIKDLQAILQVPPDELKRQLKPLVSKKFKILNKSPAAQYDVSHVLSVNMSYNPARRKIRIPLVAAKTSDPERRKNILAVREGRKHAIEACIVRVMKSRQSLEHVQLVTEVSGQLLQHFKPDPRDIKKRIEDLIGREYLERHPNKANVYNYLA